MSNANFTNASLLFMFVAILGFAIGACKPNGVDNAPQAVRDACEAYCARAHDCKDEVRYENCRTRCIDAMTDCQADEQAAAIDELELCAQESCDDVLACRISAGARCVFGL